MGSQYGKGFHDGMTAGRPTFGPVPIMIAGAIVAEAAKEIVKFGIKKMEESRFSDIIRHAKQCEVRDELNLAEEVNEILRNRQKNEQKNQHKNPLRFVRKE